MKTFTIDNTAAAGAACAVLLVQSLPGLYLAFNGVVPFGWQSLLSGALSAAMLGSAALIILAKRIGWTIAWVAEFVALIWIALGAFEHPVLLKADDFILSAIKAITVVCLASFRLLNNGSRHAVA